MAKKKEHLFSNKHLNILRFPKSKKLVGKLTKKLICEIDQQTQLYCTVLYRTVLYLFGETTLTTLHLISVPGVKT